MYLIFIDNFSFYLVLLLILREKYFNLIIYVCACLCIIYSKQQINLAIISCYEHSLQRGGSHNLFVRVCIHLWEAFACKYDGVYICIIVPQIVLCVLVQIHKIACADARVSDFPCLFIYVIVVVCNVYTVSPYVC